MRRTALIILFPLSLAQLKAQAPDLGNSCSANDPAFIQRMYRDDPAGSARMAIAKDALDARTAGFVNDRGGGDGFVIPVVFHVIHAHGPENISDAQIIDAIRVMNEDFNRENPDWIDVQPEFLDLVADVGITFRLAQLDPNGNCTNGITRTVSDLTYEGDFEMTQLIQWPRNRYLNIWVGQAANGAAGYTNYPWVLDGSPNSDGIVVQASYVGSIGTSNPGRSHVLSHEVGHWLNLKHCWGNSNDPGLEENCGMDDDVQDTPLTIGWTSCALRGASCGSALDNIENYMEYAGCRKMFTIGQSDRMIAALTSPVAQREELWQQENLELTGVSGDPALCSARFVSDRRQVCVGQTITFSDASFNNVTERTWTFPGGEPASSSEASVSVTYAIPGNYAVSLNVSDGISNLTTSDPIAVEVLPLSGEDLPMTEGFESGNSLEGTQWTVVDPFEDGGFAVVSGPASSGTRSIRLANNEGLAGRIDELISGTYDLSGMTDVELSFRYAFARREPTNDDRLRIFVSNDCGTTWSLRKQLFAGSFLATAPDHLAPFVPEPDEWVGTQVANIGEASWVTGFRFKFEFESDGGNDLYLDDINLRGGSVGLDDHDASRAALRIVPNPASQAAQVIVPMEHPGSVRIEILDLLGHAAIEPWSVRLAAGDHRVDLPISGSAAGAYLVKVTTPTGSRTARLLVLERQ
ncbi:MAG TPA: M43 family zinc metalloprotease [Flavobacteriales bacterium]|nr:M43 family zinc metalloprotease [Flavobacteriales bacterium]